MIRKVYLIHERFLEGPKNYKNFCNLSTVSTPIVIEKINMR